MEEPIINLSLNSENEQNYSTIVSKNIFDFFKKAIKSQFPDVSEDSIAIVIGKMADYQCNSAMSVSQVFDNLSKGLILNN